MFTCDIECDVGVINTGIRRIDISPTSDISMSPARYSAV